MLSRVIVFVGLCLLFSCSTLCAHDQSLDSTSRGSCIFHLGHKDAKGNYIQDNTIRPLLSDSVLTKQGHFMIHFDRLGSNAVDPTDNNKNNIPDYIDSVAYYIEYSFDFEVRVLGFREPRPYKNGSKSWDIYIGQIGGLPGFAYDNRVLMGYYGLTYSIEDTPKSCDATKNVATGFIVLDNDFSITDSIPSDSVTKKRSFRDTGVTALRITIAHELHHLIQFGYDANTSALFYEMTGVWMEHRTYAESTDYFQYLRPLMASQETRYFTDMGNAVNAGYAHAFFLQFIQETRGDAPIVKMWELLGSCVPNPYLALDSALALSSSSLAASWSQFMTYVYHTGTRAKENNMSFSNAELMPLLRPDNPDYFKFSAPSFTINFSLYPYQFKLIRCTVSEDPNRAADTADVMCTSINTNAAVRGESQFSDMTFTVSKSQSSSSRRLGSTNFFYSLTSSTGSVIYDTLFFNGGFTVRQFSTPYPQPYIAGTDLLRFPVNESIPTDAKVRLTIATVEGSIALSEEVVVNTDPDVKSQFRYVTWTKKPENLNSGVYYYSVNYNDNDFVGTFLVKR